MLNLSDYLSKCIEIAESAVHGADCSIPEARAIKQNFLRDVKIVADMAIERYIIQALSEVSPYPILSEEAGALSRDRKGEDMRWIVDPLDGSLNFSRNIPLNCISIGLWEKNEPVLGVIHDFNHGETYSGIVYQGAWQNGKPIKTSNVRKRSNAVICTGFPVSTDFSSEAIGEFVDDVQKYKKVRLLGTAALSLAFVACGRVDVYRENHIKLWDVAAGLAIVKAAGGRIEVTSTSEENVLKITASNGNLEI